MRGGKRIDRGLECVFVGVFVVVFACVLAGASVALDCEIVRLKGETEGKRGGRADSAAACCACVCACACAAGAETATDTEGETGTTAD